MNIQQRQAEFSAVKAELARKGVVLPGVTMFLPQEWKEDFDLALDAATGPLVTDPNSAIPAILTTTIDPEILRVIFSPLEFAKILTERRAGTWVDDVKIFPIIETTGEVSSYGDFNNNGRAGVNMNWPQFQSYLFQTMVKYGEREIDRAGLAKINYVSELGVSAATLLNTFQNLTYAFGLKGLQNYGLINNPYLSAFLTPSLKAWGGTSWFNGNAPAATANEVYADIQSLVTKLVSQTNGALDIKSPMKLLMSPNSEIALTFANAFGVYVEDLLKKGFPNMKVMTAPQYGQQTSLNPQGYSTGGNVIQLIAEKVQGQTVAYAAFNEKLRSHKIIPESSAWQQKQTSGTWGTILRSPVAMVGMIGV